MYKSSEKKILGEKILLRRTSDNIRASLDDKQYYPQNSIFIITSDKINLHFLLGILNSSLINYIYRKKCPQVGKIFAEIKPSIIKELPVKTIIGKSEENSQEEIIKNVNLLIKLNSELKEEKLQTKIDQIKQRIAHSEEKINELVYELYDLTKEEIKIIEGESQ